MTYSEIYNAHYGDDETPIAELELSSAHVAAWNILKNLNGRSGFDAWWNCIDDDNIRDEIFLRMVQEIKKAQALVA